MSRSDFSNIDNYQPHKRLLHISETKLNRGNVDHGKHNLQQQREDNIRYYPEHVKQAFNTKENDANTGDGGNDPKKQHPQRYRNVMFASLKTRRAWGFDQDTASSNGGKKGKSSEDRTNSHDDHTQADIAKRPKYHDFLSSGVKAKEAPEPLSGQTTSDATTLHPNSPGRIESQYHFYYNDRINHGLQKDTSQQNVKWNQDQPYINGDSGTFGTQSTSSTDGRGKSNENLPENINHQEYKQNHIPLEDMINSNGKRNREALEDTTNHEKNNHSSQEEKTSNVDGKVSKDITNQNNNENPDFREGSPNKRRKTSGEASESINDQENKENYDSQEVTPSQNGQTKGNVLGDVTYTRKVTTDENADKKTIGDATNNHADTTGEKKNAGRTPLGDRTNNPGKDRRGLHPQQGKQPKNTKPPKGDGKDKNKGQDPSGLKAQLAALKAQRNGLVQQRKGTKGKQAKSALSSEIKALNAQIKPLQAMLRAMGLA